MRANFDNKLSELNKKLLSMAAMTEQIIAMSIKSLEEPNPQKTTVNMVLVVSFGA